MLSSAVLTNKVYIAWSDSFLVLASNGNTVWLEQCLLHSHRWMTHRGDRHSLCQDRGPDVAQGEDSCGPRPVSSWSHCEGDQ